MRFLASVRKDMGLPPGTPCRPHVEGDLAALREKVNLELPHPSGRVVSVGGLLGVEHS